MGLDLLALEHGPGIAALAVIAALALGAAASVPRGGLAALRALWALRARVAGARLGIARVQPGDRVIVAGRIESIGEARTIDGAPCAATTASCGSARLHERALVVAVRVGARRVEIAGPIAVDAAPDARRLPARALDVATLVRLADAELYPDLGAVAAASVRAGDHVIVVGRAELVLGDDAGYRGERALAIVADDGPVRAIGLPGARALAPGRAAVAALVAAAVAGLLLVASASLSLARADGSIVGWDALAAASIDRALAERHVLPPVLWAPLAFPPTREAALARASSWVTAELATSSDPHLLAIARALGPLHPDPVRDAWLALRSGRPADDRGAKALASASPVDDAHRPGLAALRVFLHRRFLEALRGAPPSAAPEDVPPADAGGEARLARLDRARGWGLLDVTPSAGIESVSPMYETTALLLSARRSPPSPYLRAWLRDVALLEAALGHDDDACSALEASRGEAPSADDVVVGVALTLAARAELRETPWRPDPAPQWIARSIARPVPGAPPSYERDVIEALADSDSTPRHLVGRVVAELRAAGAAWLLDDRQRAAWLAERAIRDARALPPVAEDVRASLFGSLP